MALLPLRVIHDTNQDWPLVSWPLTLCVVGLTLYALHLAGRQAAGDAPSSQLPAPSSAASGPWSVVRGPWSFFSPWLTHFAFPICFILLAVQWPYRIEHSLTQGLMRLDTKITVEVLGWLNIPAIQKGNLIELATGTVGVDEACSGIRSFQSTLMAALFLGELYLFRPRLRLLLGVGGLALAFGFNVIRTVFLAWQTSVGGTEALGKWHDPAGFTIAIACLLVLWAIAALVNRRSVGKEGLKAESRELKAEMGQQVKETAEQPDEGAEQSGKLRVESRNGNTETQDTPSVSAFSFQLSAFPRTFLLAIGLWSLCVIGFNESWYRSHAANPAQSTRWWVNYPTNLPSFTSVPISHSAAKLLKHDQEANASWTEPDGSKWFVYSLRWNGGDPAAHMSAQGHRPEYCMTGSGHQMNAELGTRYIQVHGLKLPFRTYIFDSPQNPLYVFFCLWEDGAESQVGFGKSKQGDRLRSVLDRRRGQGQQTLEIICSGYEGIEQAQAAVTARLPNLIKIEPPNHR